MAELTPEEQARRDHWARVHIEADRRPFLPSLATRQFRAAGRLLGSGTRIERKAEA